MGWTNKEKKTKEKHYTEKGEKNYNEIKDSKIYFH